MSPLKKLERNGVHLKYEDVVRICQKYSICELSVFGSALREDFNDGSDIDILITYADVWSNDPFDFMYIEEEFKQLLDREIDIVDKDAIRNPIRREDILATMEVIYAN